MFSFKKHVRSLPQYLGALIAITILMACNVISIFNKNSPILQSPDSQVVQPTAIELDEAYQTYEGEINGVKYSIEYPANFIYSTADGWDKFCLDVDDNLCVAVRRPDGLWNDPETMATDVMTGFGNEVNNFNIYHQQHTITADGFTAYWVGCTYSMQDVNFESSHLFVVVQHVGFEIAGYGEAEMMKTYDTVIKKMMESFLLGYN
jgi:hypothetical protein